MIRHRPLQFALSSLQRTALLFALCALPFASVYSQSTTATLSGTVEDEHGAVIPGVNITVINQATGAERQATTNGEGYFVVPLLPPSRYQITAQNQGFTTVRIPEVVLNVGDQKALKIQLKAGDINATVQVVNDAPLINESPTVSTVVDRQFVGNLPLNGRSFQSLISLTPGVVLTKTSPVQEQGQFSVNGQRPNANYFMVDGVSANMGLSNSTGLGQQGGGTTPGLTVLGGTNNLVSVDALQEFKVQTSTFAPEFGRTPGGQISILTRSGTNRFSGTVFDYIRNDALNASDWFNNALRLPKPAERQHDFGGVLGGPIIKNRTFFFFSYEGLRLRLPQTKITDVPSLSSRQDPRASAAIRRLLSAFPLPNGPEAAGGIAQFAASFSSPSTLDATSIRVDHTVSHKLTLFGRYNHAPSDTVERGTNASLNQLLPTQLNTQTLTAGATWAITPNFSNDFRANYSRISSNVSFLIDDFGGAVPPPDSLFSSNLSPQENLFAMFLAGGRNTVFTVGANNRNRQRQVNLVDNLSVITGPHQLKFGIDYRRISPIFEQFRFNEFLIFNDVDQAITGRTALISVQSTDSNVLFFTNFSAFAQDMWKITRRLTLTYGLRWDVNPPPTGEKELFTFTGFDNPATLTLAPQGTPLWETTYSNFAPRIGLAYQLSQEQGRETVLRGGFGVFYDLGTGSTGNVVSGSPYSRFKSLFGETYPSAQAVPIPFTLDPPYGFIFIFDPNLKLPRTYQWNITLEQSLGTNQIVSAAYVGASGRRLLRLEQLNNPNPNITTAIITRNKASSDYHSLQLQLQRRLSRRLQALASLHLVEIA
jgi:outer membrane receptor protein involved in Fe transport